MDPMPYDTQREFTIAPGCPWYEAQQSFGPPNVNWCEPTQCSYINEPANSWSNLGFLLVFIVLIQKFKSLHVRHFAYCVLAMGTVSFIYHATNNYLSQYIDFIGMFLVTSFLLGFNSKRVFKSANISLLTYFWFFFALHNVTFMIFDIVHWPVQPIIALGTLPVLILDLIAGARLKILRQYSYYGLSFLTLVAAQTFAIIDIQRIYCNPENSFLHGHVLWHLLASVSMLLYGFHMNRVQTDNF